MTTTAQRAAVVKISLNVAKINKWQLQSFVEKSLNSSFRSKNVWSKTILGRKIIWVKINLVQKFTVFKNFNINLAQRFISNKSNKYGLEQIPEEPLKPFYIPNQVAKLEPL